MIITWFLIIWFLIITIIVISVSFACISTIIYLIRYFTRNNKDDDNIEDL
jgi:heme/copper-type cytochrome/quinol oxidase subunit 2